MDTAISSNGRWGRILLALTEGKIYPAAGLLRQPSTHFIRPVEADPVTNSTYSNAGDIKYHAEQSDDLRLRKVPGST